MSISLKTHKILWGKSGNRCAFPDCRVELAMNSLFTDDPSVVGQEAHIVARKSDGPRGQHDVSHDRRDLYSNLILLCSVHHKIVDDNPNEYTVEILHEFKSNHEKWVTENLSNDENKEKIDLAYISYLVDIERLLSIDNWKAWSSHLAGTEKSLPHFMPDSLLELNQYILNRVWFRTYPELERSFTNLKNVSNDLLKVYFKHADNSYKYKEFYKELSDEEKEWHPKRTKRFYKIDVYDEEMYNDLLSKYEYHCGLLDDLLFELARAINYMYDCVRKFLYPGYRVNEGLLLLEFGPNYDFSTNIYRPEYSMNDLKLLYPGLRKFMRAREERDIYFGKGVSEDYFHSF